MSLTAKRAICYLFDAVYLSELTDSAHHRGRFLKPLTRRIEYTIGLRRETVVGWRWKHDHDSGISRWHYCSDISPIHSSQQHNNYRKIPTVRASRHFTRNQSPNRLQLNAGSQPSVSSTSSQFSNPQPSVNSTQISNNQSTIASTQDSTHPTTTLLNTIRVETKFPNFPIRKTAVDDILGRTTPFRSILPGKTSISPHDFPCEVFASLAGSCPRCNCSIKDKGQLTSRIKMIHTLNLPKFAQGLLISCSKCTWKGLFFSKEYTATLPLKEQHRFGAVIVGNKGNGIDSDIISMMRGNTPASMIEKSTRANLHCWSPL
eukprot:scaffold228_cov56-Cyclotella_meneghiniana.AAC.8